MTAIAAVKTSSLISSATIGLTTSATVADDGTYSPDGFMAPGVARWVDRSSGIAVGYPALTLNVRKPTKDSRTTKITVKLVIPTLAQTSPSTATGIQPIPTKAYDHTFVGEFICPEGGTLLERETILSRVWSLFFATINASDASPSSSTGSPLRDAVTNLEPVY
jgi:hypothetical protein